MEFEIDSTAPQSGIDPGFLNRMMECDYSEPVQSTFENAHQSAIPDMSGDLGYTPTCAKPQDVRRNQNQNGYNGFGLFEKPLAMVYAPIQIFRNIYDPEDALEHGTIFKELDFPWNVGCSSSHYGGRRDGIRRG